MNFDDEKLAEVSDYNDIINQLKSIYNDPKCILFDEIQNLDKWELFVNRLQRQGYNLVITGSNSNLLSRELATHLTGRHYLISIFPLSFKEFISTCGEGPTSSEIKAKLLTYLTNGGFPEPLTNNLDYKEYLSTLLNSVLYKDVVKRYKIRSVSGIEDLAVYLISNVAKDFSYNTLSKVTKCKSVHTVEKYLGYLEEAYILFRLNKFSFKVKEQIVSNKKIYCIDNGFMLAKAFRFSPDFGKLYENIVAVELKRQGKDIYYWKNAEQEEVDFVVREGTNVKTLIQVCYDLSDPKTQDREVRSLLKAGKELRCGNKVIITENKEGVEEIEWFGLKGKVRFVPLWKWLLE